MVTSEFSLPQEVADRIGKMVMDKFEQLIAGHAQHSRRKVSFAIINERQKLTNALNGRAFGGGPWGGMCESTRIHINLLN